MTRQIVLGGLLMAVTMGLVPPAAADSVNVSIGINLGAPPKLVAIPGTPVYHAPALAYNYFSYGGHYYLFRDGAWFRASAYSGPWVSIAVGTVPPPILHVPVEYYKNPPGHWKKKGPPPWAPAWGHRKKQGYR